MSAAPPKWTAKQIQDDVDAAKAAFQKERFAEPLEAWLREVDKRSKEFEQLFDLHDIAHPTNLTGSDIPGIVESDLLPALRYLPGPPISTDDLMNLAGVTSLRADRLRSDPEAAEAVLNVIRKTVDPRRFPWLAENREPTADERRVAIFASALLHAAQRVQTDRRNDAKEQQERAVREHLRSKGLTGQKLRGIPPGAYAQFPARAVYSENEVMFGPARADVIARLWDDRMLAIECKVSNSSVNSNKRLNKDTLAKLTVWKNSFADIVVPAAMLAGVFLPSNVASAQAAGLTIFWSHRMDDLGDFVEASRT